MDERQGHWKKITTIGVGFLLINLIFCLQARAVGNISGRYLTKTATELTLEITVGTPVPASLIIIQHLPPGTSLAVANPAYKKYNAQKGEVRWLLRHVKTGVMTVQLKLTALDRPDQVSAEIRCMDPASGKLVTTRVK